MEEGKKLAKIAGVSLAVYVFIKYLLPYVAPFLLAYFLVRLLGPFTERIQRRLPWKKEVIVSVLLCLLLLAALVLFYSGSCLLTGQIRKIALNFDYYNRCVCGWIDRCCCLAEQTFGIDVEQIRTFVYASIDQAASQIRVYLVPNLMNYSMRYLKKLLDAGMFLLMLFVSVVLLVKDYEKMKEDLKNYTLYQHICSISERMWERAGQYLKAQMTIILVIIALCTLGLWLLGNPYFLVLGIAIGLMDALPFIGTGTVLLPMAVFFAFQGSLKAAAGYLALFLLTYIVREALEPRLIGSRLGVYPFVMVVVVYAGLYLFGTAGVILGPAALLLIAEILKELP